MIDEETHDKREKFMDYPHSTVRRTPEKKLKGYMILCFIAFGLILSSIIVGTIANFLESPNDDDYEKDSDYRADLEKYHDRIRVLTALTTFFRTCGGCMLAFALLLGGLTDSTLTKNVKLAMIIAAGLIIAYFFNSDMGLTGIYRTYPFGYLML